MPEGMRTKLDLDFFNNLQQVVFIDLPILLCSVVFLTLHSLQLLSLFKENYELLENEKD